MRTANISPESIYNDIASRMQSRMRLKFDMPYLSPAPSKTPDATNLDAIDYDFYKLLDSYIKGVDVTDEEKRQIEDAIIGAAAKYQIDPNLIRAMIRQESNFMPNAVSSAGAMGLMQLMPGTAASLGVTDPFSISDNIYGGVKYLSEMLKRFDGDTELALAAYNSGPGTVEKYGGVPPYEETQRYVPSVLGYREQYILAQYNK